MPSETWTIRKVLSWMGDDFSKLGLPDARLDAELLVAHALKLDRVHLYMDLDRPLLPAELVQIKLLLKRRRGFEPVAYILGRREFYGRSFNVNSHVLVPRPETELLVEKALALAPSSEPVEVLDLCTGSGAIAVSIALEKPDWLVCASDISRDALEIARSNVVKHEAQDRVELIASDLFAQLQDRRFDVIVSNPPYITEGEWQSLAPDVTAHEPRLALLAGEKDSM
ncbi:MAG: peptide chain release factor N(5)-glutamine methyltransferase [Myxococcales bacterium]|nr:MAG: peptide chain release factor N(5)-glutamine methyltransferase [Myxococcales bacterium]